MPISEQFRALLQKLLPKKRKMRRTETSSSFLKFLEESGSVSVLIFFLTVLSIVLISFVGIKSSGFQFLPNQMATIRIVAQDAFSYTSKILHDEERRTLLNSVPHVYRPTFAPYEKFKADMGFLRKEMEEYSAIEEDLSAAGAQEYIQGIAEAFNERGDYRLSDADLTTILEFSDPETRAELAETGLDSIRESYKLGIYDKNDPSFQFGPDSLALFKMESGVGKTRIESSDDALTMLRVALNAQNVPPNVSSAFSRLFRNGIQPNLERDETEIEQLKARMIEQLKPVLVRVEKGASIIEPNTRVTQEQYEQHQAYIRHLDNQDVAIFDHQLIGRMLLVMAMLLAATFYIRLEDRATLKSNTRLGLLALVVLLNLGLVRFCFELANIDLFLYDPTLSAILPYITPTALAPIIIAILMGSGPGLLTALMVSLFSAVMFGNRIELFVMSFLASSVAIFICRNIRKRGRVVTGGMAAGLSIALFTLLFNWIDQLPAQTILNQTMGGFLTGLTEGIVVVGVLPILEGLFKRTTDITLLELSDYNHPLLRRMQLEAPGTWHHSLMVANLAENACNKIGKNGLMARVSCMFHDIGKLVKPDYFTENQLDGHNPHDEKTPSFSALVIKSHVKEGVDLGLTYKLPRPIIEIIRQHHGTNLIRFFYHKALKQAEENENGSTVQESTYRYDGPKPQFIESAVVLLADSLEAASRSLAKVTPQNVEELVDRIFKTNVEDGQFDECSITMKQLAQIRESFIFTLLNSLHTRIAYPAPPTKPDATPTKKAANERKQERVEANAGR